MSDEDVLRKQYYDKEFAQFSERIKVESEIAEELIPLSNISPEKVKSVFEKFHGRLDSLAKEEPPSFPKVEDELGGK